LMITCSLACSSPLMITDGPIDVTASAVARSKGGRDSAVESKGTTWLPAAGLGIGRSDCARSVRATQGTWNGRLVAGIGRCVASIDDQWMQRRDQAIEGGHEGASDLTRGGEVVVGRCCLEAQA